MCIRDSGNLLLSWGSTGVGDGQFNGLTWGIVADSQNNIYITDPNNCRIQKFTSTGIFIKKWGTCGSGDGQFNTPRGLAIDSSNYIYVADRRNGRLQKFTSDGNFITKWGGFNVWGFQAIAVDQSDTVYTIELYAFLIKKFTASGTLLTQWGTNGIGNGQFLDPRGLGFDSFGYLYAIDVTRSDIQKFTTNGTFLTKMGNLSVGPATPFGLTFDVSNNIYVTDRANSRVQVFTPASPPSTPNVLTVEPQIFSTKLRWASSTDNVGVSYYTIYRNGALIATTSLLEYTDVNCLPGSNYIYTISSTDFSGYESQTSVSQNVYTYPSPYVVSASKNAAGNTIEVVWQGDASAYQVEQGSGNNWFSGTTYIKDNITCGSTYTFRVKARNTALVETNYSDFVSITTDACQAAYTPPPAPVITEPTPVVVIPTPTESTEPGSGSLSFSGVSNVKYIAISKTADFSQVSWEPYTDTYQLPTDYSGNLFVKFRSPEGGETTPITVTPPAKTESPTTPAEPVSPSTPPVPVKSGDTNQNGLSDKVEQATGIITTKTETAILISGGGKPTPGTFTVQPTTTANSTPALVYTSPVTKKTYVMDTPQEVKQVVKETGVWVNHKTATATVTPKKLQGRILIDTQDRGRAYYANSKSGKKVEIKIKK